jgi:hypothetical protein
MKFKQFLLEKTFNINKDVDYIWDNYYKKFVNNIMNDPDAFVQDWDGKPIVWAQFPSSKLPSKSAKKATEINPINIQIGLLLSGNMYKPLQHFITLSPSMGALNAIKQQGYESIKKRYPRITREFVPDHIKSSTYHELSHWLNDSLHNKNISNRLLGKNPSESDHEEISKHASDTIKKIKQKFGDPNASDYELDAQIHGFKQLYRKHKKEWDNMSFIDMLKLKPNGIHIVSTVHRTGKKNYI